MDDRPPFAAYAGIATTFLAALTGVAALAARRNRPVEPPRAIDLALLGLATFKGARTVARDKVTSFVREPFVEGVAYDGEDEKPAGEGLQRAIGELVTCSRCIGTWIAAALGAMTILAPRTGRLLTSILAAGALNDWLLAGFSALTAKSNELESSTADERGRSAGRARPPA